MSLSTRITILSFSIINIIYSMTPNISNFRVPFHIFFLNKIWSFLITYGFQDQMPFFFLKISHVLALADVAQLVGAFSHNWRVAGLIPSQGTYLGCGFDPQSWTIGFQVWAPTGGNQSMLLSCIYVSLSRNERKKKTKALKTIYKWTKVLPKKWKWPTIQVVK